MDSYDDLFDDQMFQFSPLRLSPPPQPFTATMESLEGLVVEETERVDEDIVALVSNPTIDEVIPSTSTRSPDLFPFPEMLTLLQDPPEMEQQQLLCNSHEHLQGNLPNEPLDQQSLSNQNALNAFQGLDDFTMIDFDQLMEEENIGYANPTVTQSFELPNNLQEQFPSVPLSQSFPSYPTYQHAPVASHSNMYNQQPPPLGLADRENEPIAPRMVTDLARSQNYSSYPTYPHGQLPSQFNMYDVLDHQAPPLTNKEDAPPLIPRVVTDLPR
ncbi:unnamed protein product [Microthlaspi erraticum]|uniref:Uncharacterized protein n=1 Tax=Microthlaspi erraticum TaxID=1685480 RepID=A0A6D2INT6_9BRAS|nr:unnamed protein product [Microthlaspi erraticum]